MVLRLCQCLELSAIPVMKTKEVIFYPIFPNSHKSITFWKVPRHRPFILLVRTTLRLTWVRSIGGMIIDRAKPQYSEQKAARYHFVHHKSHTNWPGIESGPSKITGLRPIARAMARQLKTQLTLHYINFQVVPHREQTPSRLKRPVG